MKLLLSYWACRNIKALTYRLRQAQPDTKSNNLDFLALRSQPHKSLFTLIIKFTSP